MLGEGAVQERFPAFPLSELEAVALHIELTLQGDPTHKPTYPNALVFPSKIFLQRFNQEMSYKLLAQKTNSATDMPQY
jgi:hypothetical protein